MFPDNSYAPSRGSFQTPVLPPAFDPDASPTLTVSINCEWLPYIRGALQQLLLQSTWDVIDPADLALVQARAQTLISMLVECSSVELPFACPFDWPPTDMGGWYPFDISVIGYAPAAQALWDYLIGGWYNQDTANGANHLRATYVQLNVDPLAVISHVGMSYQLTKGPNLQGGWISGIQLLDAGGGLVYDGGTLYTGWADTAHSDFAIDGHWTGVSKITLAVTTDFLNGGGALGGFSRLFAASVRGSGPAPC